MTIKTFLSAALLALLPGLTFAMCGSETRLEQEATSCAEGTQWDATSATCVPVSTS